MSIITREGVLEQLTELSSCLRVVGGSVGMSEQTLKQLGKIGGSGKSALEMAHDVSALVSARPDEGFSILLSALNYGANLPKEAINHLVASSDEFLIRNWSD